MSIRSLEEQRAELCARTSTPTLRLALAALKRLEPLSEEQELAKSWIVEELERRAK